MLMINRARRKNLEADYNNSWLNPRCSAKFQFRDLIQIQIQYNTPHKICTRTVSSNLLFIRFFPGWAAAVQYTVHKPVNQS